eukprot:6206056-Pleurochrysis_carterae.AAC.6
MAASDSQMTVARACPHLRRTSCRSCSRTKLEISQPEGSMYNQQLLEEFFSPCEQKQRCECAGGANVHRGTSEMTELLSKI